MEVAPKPANEVERLALIRSLGLLDTPPEERFDRFTRFAQRLFDVPIAFVSVISDEDQWYKSIQGANIERSPRELTICSHTMLVEDDVLVIEDATNDVRFRDNPIVAGPPYMRFYAGVRLNSPDGLCIGTLCILDTKPRSLLGEDVEILTDLARMVELEFLAQAIATTDDLTRLSNRRGFRAIADHAVALCGRLDKPATLMFFDLDKFKAINDGFGHAEGDKVLRDLGQLMLQVFRDSDVVARLGGDEFCVLLTGTNAEGVEKPLANLAAAIHEENLNLPYDIEYSVGTVSFDKRRHRSIDDMLAEADNAMYEDKQSKQ
ncbi:MAG: sensor domain-containing diguanylate cyclase [Pseudomonadota bacterium]